MRARVVVGRTPSGAASGLGVRCTGRFAVRAREADLTRLELHGAICLLIARHWAGQSVL